MFKVYGISEEVTETGFLTGFKRFGYQLERQTDNNIKNQGHLQRIGRARLPHLAFRYEPSGR
jgi:hypothetical protein